MASDEAVYLESIKRFLVVLWWFVESDILSMRCAVKSETSVKSAVGVSERNIFHPRNGP